MKNVELVIAINATNNVWTNWETIWHTEIHVMKYLKHNMIMLCTFCGAKYFLQKDINIHFDILLSRNSASNQGRHQ